MREIKFRIWDIENKCWLRDGKYNQYIPTKYDFPIMVVDFKNGTYKFFEREDVEVMQYTGLKDKDGREIFEGDLISCKNNKNVHVFFDNGSFKVKYQKNINNVICTLETFLEKYKCTITGNIYENK